MGCDIHAFIEIKVDGTWHHYGPAKIKRDYDLFEYMAGVRGEVQNWPPRGLPADVSVVTQLLSDHEGVDGHTHSWLNHDEMLQVIEYGKRNQDGWEWLPFGVYFFGNGIEDWKDPSYSFPVQIQDIRLVFWFDN